MVMQRHAVAHLGSTVSGNGVADPTQFMWAMWWWPHAVLHLTNPFVTHAIWAPDAYNLGSVTSTPLPALVLSPLTAIVGPVQGPIVSYNVANLLAPVLGAWFAYRLCLRLTGAPWASILGGWLYGFSSYGLAALQGHLHLVFTFLPPVMVLLAVRYYQRDLSRLRFIALATLTLVGQLLCGTEIAFNSTVMGVITLFFAFCFVPRERRHDVSGLILPLSVAYVLTVVICSPLLYYAVTGPAVLPGNGIHFPADLLSFVIPTRMTWLGGTTFSSISADYLGNTAEQGTYLGLPLIAIALAGWLEFRRRPASRVLMAVSLIAALWSLGAVLRVDGQAVVSLPYKLIASAKPFTEVLPVRIGMFTALGVAVTAALWLSSPGGVKPGRWLVGLLAVIFLFPAANSVRQSGQPIFHETYRSPAFITQGLYRRYLRPGTVVLPIPFSLNGTSLLWQAQAQGYFRLASGWFGYFPTGYSHNRVAAELAWPRHFTDPVAPLRRFLAAHDIGAVVITAGHGGPWPGVMSQLKLRGVAAGGVRVYRVPGA
jgi:hypothetical protein